MIADYRRAHRPRPAPCWMRGGLILLFLGIVFGVGGCGSGQSAASIPLIEPRNTAITTVSDQGSAPTVALVMKTLTNPFFIAMEQGARRAEAELGLRLIVKTAAQETSIDQQIAIIESLIDQGVDAIVIAPGDSTSLVPVLAHAQQDGIVVVNIDNRLDPTLSHQLGLVNVPFISVDNEDGAYQAARVVTDMVQSPTEAIILEGIMTAQNAIDRSHGAQRAFAENPAIRLVAVETAHWKIDEAYTVTKRLLSDHPHVGVIFCSNDMMALGALQYLAETSRDEVLVAGFDALAEVRREIQAGRMVVSVDQQADQQGYLGVRHAMTLLGGGEVPAETMVPVQLITRSMP